MQRETTPRRVDQQKIRTVYEGHFRLDEVTLSTETYAGEMASPVKREVLRSGPAVAVLLFDPVADQLILTEQFRIGAHLNDLPSKWLLECVAGMVDEGETSEAAARREVEEETGCTVGELDFIGRYMTSPGITDEVVTIYVGSVDARTAGGVHGKKSEGEDIRTRIVAPNEAIAMAERGEFVNIVAQLAVLWFAHKGEALRARWLAEGKPVSAKS